jgi:hypothetical protein
MFAFLPGPVVTLMNDERFGPELWETVYAGAAASMPEHSIIYALMPSEQRAGLSDCEEVMQHVSSATHGHMSAWSQAHRPLVGSRNKHARQSHTIHGLHPRRRAGEDSMRPSHDVDTARVQA